MKKLSLLLVLLVGCAHVDLKVPPPEASREERVHTYERLKPVNAEQWRMMDAHAVKWTRSLELANGFEVQDPTDLKPAVLPDSRTAKAIEAYEHKNRAWKVIAPLAGFSFAAGATGLIASIIIGTVGQRSLQVGGGSALGIVALTSIAVMVTVPLLSLITGFIITPDSEQERNDAFGYFGNDLREMLRIDEPPPAAPPPVTDEATPQP